MTARLLLLSALALSACGDGMHPVAIGATNATSSMLLSVTYSLDGEPFGALEAVYPGSETQWAEARAPAPAAGSRYEVSLEYASGLVETIALDAAAAPAEWIHVRPEVASMTAEVSPGREVTEARAPRGDLAPSGAAPPPPRLATTADSTD